MMQLHGSPWCDNACHSAMIAASAPATGVHNHEQSIQYLPPASSAEGRHRANRGRTSRRAVSIEVWVTRFPTRPETLKRPAQTTLLAKLELDDSALQADHGGMGSVVGGNPRPERHGRGSARNHGRSKMGCELLLWQTHRGGDLLVSRIGCKWLEVGLDLHDDQ
jgi:hypothetical protein